MVTCVGRMDFDHCIENLRENKIYMYGCKNISLSHLSLLLVHSDHWNQGSLVCRTVLALPGVPGCLSYPAPLVVLELFGWTPPTGPGSGSRRSYSGTDGLQEMEGLKWFRSRLCFWCSPVFFNNKNMCCLCECVNSSDYSLWMSCSHTCRAMARTAAWDWISPLGTNNKHTHSSWDVTTHNHTVDWFHFSVRATTGTFTSRPEVDKLVGVCFAGVLMSVLHLYSTLWRPFI